MHRHHLLLTLAVTRLVNIPYPAMMEESISLEETNKIRISLGLKPLVDDGKVGDDKEKAAEDNYAKQRQREAQVKESK